MVEPLRRLNPHGSLSTRDKDIVIPVGSNSRLSALRVIGNLGSMAAIDIPSHVLESARTATFSKDELTKAARQVATFGIQGPAQKDIPHSVS